jgi:glutathione S-transferase
VALLPSFRSRVRGADRALARYHSRTRYRPYFGQLAWFNLFHPEKVPSAVDRYQKEILRVFGVLESVLSKQKWLVGDKMTIADISFITSVELDLALRSSRVTNQLSCRV